MSFEGDFLAAALALQASIVAWPDDGADSPPPVPQLAPTIESATALPSRFPAGGGTSVVSGSASNATSVKVADVAATIDAAGAWQASVAVAATGKLSVVAHGPTAPDATIDLDVTVDAAPVPPPVPSGFVVKVQRFLAPTGFAGPTGSVKHFSMDCCTDDGRLWGMGGDFNGFPLTGNTGVCPNNPGGAGLHPNSGRQEVGSCDPMLPSAWRLEYPYWGPAGDLQPFHPDEMQFRWDARRHLFWALGGQPQGDTNPPGYADNTNRGLFTFTPATRKWALIRRTYPLPSELPLWSTSGGYWGSYCHETDKFYHFTTSARLHVLDCAQALIPGAPCESWLNYAKIAGMDAMPYEYNDIGISQGEPKLWSLDWKTGTIVEVGLISLTSRIVVTGLPLVVPFPGPFKDPRYPGPDAPQSGHNNWIVWNPTIARIEVYHMDRVIPDAPYNDPVVYPYPTILNDDTGWVCRLLLVNPVDGHIDELNPVVDGIRLRGNVFRHVQGVGTIQIGGSGSVTDINPARRVPTHAQIINFEIAA